MNIKLKRFFISIFYKGDTIGAKSCSWVLTNTVISWTIKFSLLLFFLVFCDQAYGFAWPIEIGRKIGRDQILCEKSTLASRFIVLPQDNSFSIAKVEGKIIKKISLDYGINRNNSIFINLYSNFFIYHITGSEKKYDNILMKIKGAQNSVNIELGSIIKLAESQDQIISAYYSISPGVFYVAPQHEYVYTEDDAAITAGLAYGRSFNRAYFEAFFLNQKNLAINHNAIKLGLVLGYKPSKKNTISIQGMIANGYHNEINPFMEKSMNMLFDDDQVRNNILKKDLKDFFATKKVRPYGKVILRFDRQVSKKIQIFTEIGLVFAQRSIKGKYASIGLEKTI